MKLYIDTSDREKIVLGLNDKKVVCKNGRDKSECLLALIRRFLQKNKTSINEIKELEVNLGPGSFTGLRVGVSVANALGWGLGIPVNGKDLRKSELVDIVYK